MATCRVIIQNALRRAGVLGAHEEADAPMLSAGMVTLQGLIDSYRGGLLGIPRSVTTSLDVTAEPMTRVYAVSLSVITVTLPTRDAVQVEKPMRDGDLIEVVDEDGPTAAYFRFSSDLGQWVHLNNLDIDDVFPLGPKHEWGFTNALAEQVISDYGTPDKPLVFDAARKWRGMISGRFEGDRPAVGTYF
jgi:hypothetical protein